MDLTTLNNMNLDDCGKPIITLSAAGDCNENSFIIPVNPGAISGDLTPVPGITKEDKYAVKVNVRACIIRMPREITRQVSFNCRTQRVETAVKYRIQGYDSFTTDKMDEVERVFLGRKIWVNGVEVQFEGGNVFEPLGQNYPNEYRLNVEVTECPLRITYGCGNTINCGPPKWTYVIPEGVGDADRFINSNNQFIADSFDGLLQYYRVQPRTAEVKEVTDDYAGLCAFYRAFEVTTYGVVPDSFYVGQISARNRVFGRQLEDESEFCDGLPKDSRCTHPVLGTPILEDTDCQAPTLGDPIFEGEACGIELVNGWLDVAGGTNIRSINGETELSITVQNPALMPIPSHDTVEVPYSGILGHVCYWEDDALQGYDESQLIAVMVDNVEVDPETYEFDGVNGSISFYDPCADVITEMKAIFQVGESSGEITVNQTIARIGQSCAPYITLTASANDYNPAMPEDGTITINPFGDVIYNGPILFDVAAKIELFNITFLNQ